MFFIPIAALLLVVYYIIHCVCLYRTAQYDAAVKQRKERISYLTSNYTDREMQRKVLLEHEKKYDLNKKIVCDFMGGDDIWKEYTGYFYGDTMATAVILAQNGMIHTDFLSPLNRIYYGIKNDPRKSAEMNVQFMLALEKELNRNGVGVTAMFQNPLSGENPDPAHPLGSYVSENGCGLISPNAHFWIH